VSITSGSGFHAQIASKKYQFKYTALSENEILNDPQVNTVSILTRHNLHSEQVIRALRAGKHVFCEKPLATTPLQLSLIKQELLNGDVSTLLMVGFNRRFSPMARRLFDLINSHREPLVATYRINAGNIPLTHWVQDSAQGGGRIIGETCHFIDFLTFLVGTLPTQVTSYSLPDDDRYNEDNVAMTFNFPDGSIGSIFYLANGDKSFPKERIEIFSGGIAAVLEDFRSLEVVSHGKRQFVRSSLRQDKGHRAEWEAFSKAIIAGGPPPIPYDQLIGVTAATFAAVTSIRNRQPVLLDSSNT
jgi:predicted dehydrogenase